MDYVMASSSKRSVEECRRMLGHVPGIDFRVGSVSETGWDCDAAILNSPLAHERYGGIPRIGEVQTLANHRDDGAPGVIIAAAPIGADKAIANPSDDNIASYVLQVLDSCVAQFVQAFPDRAGKARVLVHLEAAGIDRRNIEVPLRGAVMFFEGSQAG